MSPRQWYPAIPTGIEPSPPRINCRRFTNSTLDRENKWIRTHIAPLTLTQRRGAHSDPETTLCCASRVCETATGSFDLYRAPS